MIRRSPSEYYLKYLLVHPEKYADAQIIKICDVFGFEHLSRDYLKQLREAMVIPTPFRPIDKLHMPSQRFIRKEMIHKVFFPDEAMREAFSILSKARVRELVEVMILSGAPHTAIVFGLKSRQNVTVSLAAIDFYRHYFWDVDLLDTTELRAFLLLRLQRSIRHEDSDVKAQWASVDKQKYSDPRIVAAKMPNSPIAAIFAQINLGIMPKDLRITDVLENVRLMGSLRALEAAMEGGPRGAQTSTNYMMTADIANKMLETVIKPEEQLREELRQIAMKSTANKVPMLRDISQGNHTMQVQPEPKAADAEQSERSAG